MGFARGRFGSLTKGLGLGQIVEEKLETADMKSTISVVRESGSVEDIILLSERSCVLEKQYVEFSDDY